MDIEKLFPSRFVNGAELKGREVTVTIARVVMVKMRPNPQTPESEKPVCYFVGAKKGLVVEKRLAYQLAEATGEHDTDRWPGKTVVLFPENVKVAGRELCVIRVKAAPVHTGGETGQPGNPSQPEGNNAPESDPPESDPPMTIEAAEYELSITTHELYGSLETPELVHRLNSMTKVKQPNQDLKRKINAIQMILAARAEGRPVLVLD